MLWTEGTPRQSAALKLLHDAMEQVVAQAYEAGSGNILVPLALMAATSKNRAAMSRGIYHMSTAVGFGIDERWNIAVVRFLNEMGRNEDARELAASLHRDESSMYYESAELEQWITYLDSEIQRNERIAASFVSLGNDASSQAREYLPVSKAAPVYPPEAVEAGLEGYVIVEFTVEASGRTADARVVTSSNTIFDEAALDAASRFLYLPRVAGGTAMDVPGVRNKITFVGPQQ
jgi:TonB family protein